MVKGSTAPSYKNIWSLKTEDMLQGLSWHWWWWIFFIDNPSNPSKPKQLMILWSTKQIKQIEVNGMPWKQKNPPSYENGKLTFNGMTAAWWYDGEKMVEPLMLDGSDFEVKKDGGSGELNPLLEGKDYRFYGNSKRYHVNIVDEDNDFRFELTPWNPYLQDHRFNEQYYIRNYNYNILKIYGMKLNGLIDGEKVTGSGYFQRVSVNSPAMPWYWGLIHCEDGSFIQYFKPFIGLQIFRTKPDQNSYLDRGDIALSKDLLFYHKGTDTEYKFDKKYLSIDYTIRGQLPVVKVIGEDSHKKLQLTLKAYSRAYWRFEQPRKYMMKSILFYNEYPAVVKEFKFSLKDKDLEVGKEDLGKTYSNFEHSWGKLL
ncbi:MAG: hypothetical protein ACOC53_07455 [Candidatus Saliniplasma sp.]